MAWSGSAPNQTFSRNTGLYTGATAWQQTEAASRGIRADDHDTHDEDIADGLDACVKKDGGNKLTASIPANGFGMTGMGVLGTAAEATVASATTANVLGAASLMVQVTGTTTITSLGTGASQIKVVRFADALTLTHNATSLILPTGADITAAAGDTMIVVSDASSNARVVAYERANGTPLSTTLSTLSASGTVAFTGIISPSQITGNQDDYAPTGHATANVFRLSTDASRNITGLAGGASGRIVIIHNVGSNNIVLKDDTTSTAANRFALTGDITLAADAATMLQYDNTSSRWRCIGGVGSTDTASVAEIRTGTAAKAITVANWMSALAEVTLTDGATVTVDFQSGINFAVSLGGNRTLAASNHGNVVGRSGYIKVTESGGTRTLDTTASPFKTVNGADIVIGTGSGDVHIYFYQIIDSSNVLLSLARDIS